MEISTSPQHSRRQYGTRTVRTSCSATGTGRPREPNSAGRTTARGEAEAAKFIFEFGSPPDYGSVAVHKSNSAGANDAAGFGATEVFTSYLFADDIERLMKPSGWFTTPLIDICMGHMWISRDALLKRGDRFSESERLFDLAVSDSPRTATSWAEHRDGAPHRGPSPDFWIFSTGWQLKAAKALEAARAEQAQASLKRKVFPYGKDPNMDSESDLELLGSSDQLKRAVDQVLHLVWGRPGSSSEHETRKQPSPWVLNGFIAPLHFKTENHWCGSALVGTKGLDKRYSEYLKSGHIPKPDSDLSLIFLDSYPTLTSLPSLLQVAGGSASISEISTKLKSGSGDEKKPRSISEISTKLKSGSGDEKKPPQVAIAEDMTFAVACLLTAPSASRTLQNSAEGVLEDSSSLDYTQVWKAYDWVFSRLKIVQPEIPKQIDNCQCGPLALLALHFFCYDKAFRDYCTQAQSPKTQGTVTDVTFPYEHDSAFCFRLSVWNIIDRLLSDADRSE